MSWIEQWLNEIEQNKPVSKTGDLVAKEFKNPSKDLKDIKTKEYIEENLDKLFIEIWLNEKDKDEIINELLKYWENKENLGKIINSIKKDDTIFSKEDVLKVIKLNSIETNEEKIKWKIEETKWKLEKIELGTKKDKLYIKENDWKTEEKIWKIEKFNNLYSSLWSLDKNNPNYWALVWKINTLVSENWYTEELFDEIMWELKNPAKLKFIAEDLQVQDQKNGTHTYENFKTNLINIDSSFRESFDDIETGFHNAADMVKVWTNTDKWLEKKWDIITQSKDWISTEVDDWERKLSLNDSDYKLDSPLKNEEVENEINDKKEEFTDFMEWKNEELNTLSSMMDYIDTAITNNLEITVVKEELKDKNNDVYNELHLDWCNDLQEIKNLLAWAYKQKDEEKKEFIKRAKKVVDEIVSKNASKAKEKDEKTQDILKFLSSIWFDQIPQDVTDSIIETINQWNLLAQFGFQNKIDLANGDLWINLDFDMSKTWFQEKIKFMEFFNILITWDKTKPIDVNSVTVWEPLFKDSNWKIITNKNSYIKELIWSNPKLLILSNMEKNKSSKWEKSRDL